MAIDVRRLLAFTEELISFAAGLNLLADEFSRRTSALEAMMDEVDDLTNDPDENNEAIKVLTNAVIRLAELSINYMTNELNKAKEELEKIRKEWGEIYGNDSD